ncbi:CUGBP Elav-like family member 2 isoform X6 [Eupeodes corollae]|uniref:CUGBP Elav-like family member 2 isoform X6 n=1 Tax=Eupeodes corollae TaxID=290404 RepID=UPI0024932924|nr:CUGBP Elav-like family member 2 isoform X6 [Eupeodes corollae]
MKNNTTSVTEATTNDNNSDIASRSSSSSIVIGSGSVSGIGGISFSNGISSRNSNSNGIRNITQLMPSVIGNLSNSCSSSAAKTYPSINSAYWQPSPYPTPYVVPERKLFVGMLNKKLNENEVRKLFEPFGTIEECTVLRDQNGQSKGCAFVTFSTKQSAISAIKVTLNQNKIMDGCTSPLVVKFADTQKEKEQKKIQQIQANLWNLASNINIPLGQTATSVSTPILPNPPQQASPVLGSDAITPSSLQFLQQLQAVGLQQQILQGLSAQTGGADASAAAAAFNVQNLAAIAAMTQPSLTASAAQPGSAQLTNAAALLCLLGKTANSGSDANSLTSAYMSSAAGLPQFGSTALSTSPLASVALSTAAAVAAGKQIEDLMNRTSICLMCEGVLKHAGSSGRAQGPEGCNLFIYHLPQEFTDTDLASTFLPFGNVISAKVFIDKQTNLSKCFGFVSFDNAESAQVAIKAMHGFQVGTKRLKVQLKKPKDASKPY